ncbi:MAG: DUF1501 domain-containing protein [Gammaproteobacteria bacterium]
MNNKTKLNVGRLAHGADANAPENPGRRTLLQSLLAVAALPPGLSFAASNKVARRLILVELAGGNDGLNTVIPYSQKRYYEARPGIAIKRDELVTLDNHFGLHPNLAPLKTAWDNNDVHIALGVGYPDPNRSHFRSSDIWHTASGSDQMLKRGWLADGFTSNQSARFSAEGISLGGDYGPFVGSSQSLVMDNPVTFAKQARMMRPAAPQPGNAALDHVVGVRLQITRALDDLNDVINARKNTRVKGSELHKQLMLVSDMIAADVRVPLFKTKLKGFDTHFHQPNRHKGLMKVLGEELAGLRLRLIDSGHWNETLVMTYSEFGRRAAENGSRGTDHGTAAPVILMGGALKGGFSGRQPDFPKNNDEDLSFHVDYRQIYRTVADQWLDAQAAVEPLKQFKAIDIFS